MDILKKLTLKNLKQNRKRTIVTILGIMLSIALICAVTTFVASFREGLINRTIARQGNYHMIASSVQEKDIKFIRSNVQIEKLGTAQIIGYAKIDSQNDYKPYLYIQAFDDTSCESRALKLIEGRLPQNSSEIVMPEHLTENGGVEFEIGDTITLSIGKRYCGEDELTQYNPYFTEQDSLEREEEAERFIEIEKRNYTIVGKIERPSFEEYSAPGYTAITKLEKQDPAKLYEFTIVLKNPAEVLEMRKDFEKRGIAVEENWELLRWQGVFANQSDMQVIIIIAIIVIAIIVFTSIFVIKNSFQISITERIKQFGMLASIGATSKQIKKSVLFEGAVLASLSIPLGILVGIGAMWIVIEIVNKLLLSIEFIDNFEIHVVVSTIAILVAIFISIITIFLSCILPARKASKISPIDAIRETNDIKIKPRKLRTLPFTKKLLGIEGQIAAKNLKRSRKKYRTTIFSIFLSIVLFLSMSSLMEYAFRTASLEYKEVGYNIGIINMGIQPKEKLINYYQEIAKLEEVKSYVIDRTKAVQVPSEIYFDTLDTGDSIILKSIGEEAYKKYVKELGLNYEAVKDKGILYDTAIRNVYEEDHFQRIEYTMLTIQEKELLEYQVLRADNTYEKGNIEIAKRVTKTPMGIYQDIGMPIVFISDEKMNKWEDTHIGSMYINSKDANALQTKIESLEESKDIYINNIEKQKRQNDTIILVVSIFVYGFIAVISIIGMTNIFNTITTNMLLRSREFAILKSIGMTNKEFNKMIFEESLLYGTKALFFGLPVGLLISYWIYNIISQSFKMIYHFPIVPVCVCIAFVFIIIFITMRYAVKKTQKQNIIETIRKENV